MKTIIFIVTFLITLLTNVTSQSQWQKTIGGTGDDQARSIIQTNDGGFIITGFTNSFGAGNYDFYFVKLSSSGVTSWTKTIGGIGEEMSLSIIKTSDGGFAAVGHKRPSGYDSSDFYIVKFDSSFTTQWNKVINRANNDYGFSVKQTNDGGFVIAGSSGTGYSEMYIVKLSSAGTFQWSRTYEQYFNESAYSIIQTADGGFVFAGYTNWLPPSNASLIIKTSDIGMIQWKGVILETGTGSEFYSIIQTSDSGFALAGGFAPTGIGNYDMYIVKLNSSGSLQWTRTVGGTGNDMANSIVQTTDGGFAAAGYTNSYGAGNYDMYIVKLNSSGTLQWSKTVGGTGDDQAQSLIKTTDGGFVVVGNTSSFGAGAQDFFIVRLDSAGNTCGNSSVPPTISGTGGTLGNPSINVLVRNPTLTTPIPLTGTGGILTTICSTLPPPAPILVSPTNGSYNQPSTVRFTWNKSLYAATYRLQVALDSQFINLAVNDSTITDSTLLVINLTVNRYYWWRVNAKNAIGTSLYSSVWKFGTFFVGLKELSSEIPKEFKLFNNYPNPFNPVTKIRFDVPSSDSRFRGNDNVVLIIYDMLGREVETLVNEQLQPGTYEVEFSATGGGLNLPSGVYYYTINAGSFSQTKKMVLIK